jgi:nickel/cobalt transporter (NicO) family protein
VPRILTSVAAAAVLLLLGVLAAALPVGANPMLGPKTAEAPAPPVEAPAVAGALGTVARAALGFQREANRRIGLEMRAIRDGRTTGALLGAVLLALAYGALHALGPGHGKVVVMGYFLSREARIGRGLLMGGQIALAHTASAVVIVTFADLLLRRAFGGVPAEIPAVRAASYGLIVLIGGLMLVRALRAARGASASRPHEHRHGPSCGCGGAAAPRGEGGLLSLGVGLVPCTGSVLILLYAFANDILWAGLVLVAAVAAGMAVTMGALGLASVAARRLLVARLAGRGGGARALALVDVTGAALITGVGLFLLATSL